MRKLTTFVYAAIAALGLSAPITANAAGDGYVEAGTDELTYDLLYEKANGGSNSKFTIGSADGMIGTYNISKLWFSTESKTIYPDAPSDYIIILAPEGTFIDSIELTDPSNSTYVRQSNTLPTFDNYQSIVGETFGNTEYTLNSANPKVTFPTERSHAIIAYTSNNAGCKAFKISYKKAAGSAGGGLIDHINVANLKAANPDGNFSATGYMDRANANAELTMTGDSGAEYKLTQVIANDTWWCNDWDYPSPQGECYNTSSENYIKSISFDFDYVPSSLVIYLSNEPITKDNKYSAGVVSKNLYKNYDTGKFDTWEADGIYKYFYLGIAQERITDLAIEYTTEKPELTAAAPTIQCYESSVNPNTDIYVNCDASYKINLKVYHNDKLDEELSKDDAGNYCQFKAGGKAGEVLKVEAFAYATDYNDSEVVTATWTLVAPPAATPKVINPLNYQVIPGQELVIETETENATINYTLQYEDWTSWPAIITPLTSGSGATPLTIKVPEDAEIGMQLGIIATATADGYSESEKFEYSYEIISEQLPAPYFSVEDKAEVIKGSSITISKQGYNADKFHYIVNGGEEQVSEDYNAKVAINEDSTIEAWVSGPEPFKDSEHVTISVFVEKFTDTQHVLVPETFTTDSEKLNDQYINEYTATVNGISYTYKGGLENYYSSYTETSQNTFYMNPRTEDNSSASSILYNTTPVETGIQAFKITNTSNYNAVYVAVSDEPITEITDELKGWDEPTAANIYRMRIGDPRQTEVISNYNAWVKVSDYINPTASEDSGISPLDDGEVLKQFVPKYFAFYAFGTGSNRIARVIVDVTDPSTVGVAGVETEGLDNGEIYDLNGVRVNGDNLAPGVYIRKANGKAQKFLVK